MSVKFHALGKQEGGVGEGGREACDCFFPCNKWEKWTERELARSNLTCVSRWWIFHRATSFFFFLPLFSVPFRATLRLAWEAREFHCAFFLLAAAATFYSFWLPKKKKTMATSQTFALNIISKHYATSGTDDDMWVVFFFFLALSMRFGTRPTVPQSLKRTFSCITVLLLEKGWFFIYLYFLRRGCWGSRDSAYLHVPVNALAQKSA